MRWDGKTHIPAPSPLPPPPPGLEGKRRPETNPELPLTSCVFPGQVLAFLRLFSHLSNGNAGLALPFAGKIR